MKNLILLASLILLSLSCYREKQCQNIAVGNISCDPAFESFSEAHVFPEDSASGYGRGGSYLAKNKITDSIAYDSIFSNRRPLGNINFDKWMLFTVVFGTQECKGLEYATQMCINRSASNVKLKIHYSLYDQCAGSGLNNYHIQVWAKLPISYKYWGIDCDIVNINPVTR